VLGPIIIAVIAQSENRALATKQCVGETCTSRAEKSGDAQKTLDANGVQGLASVRPYRISCGDGHVIVAKRFNGVRASNAKGAPIPVLADATERPFRIVVDRRMGGVVGRTPIWDPLCASIDPSWQRSEDCEGRPSSGTELS
jgi:hypothetical protein